MGLLDSIVSLGSGLLGAFGASQDRANAEKQRQALIAQREQYLREMGIANDQAYNDLRSNNMQALRASTGLLNDSLISQGRSLGDAAASAGVYNSTGVSGAIESNAAANAAALASLAAKNFQSEQGMLNDNQQSLTKMKLGYNNQDLNYQDDLINQAKRNQAATYGSLGSGIADLVGALSPRNSGQMMNGNQGSKAVQSGDTGGGWMLPNGTDYVQPPIPGSGISQDPSGRWIYTPIKTLDPLTGVYRPVSSAMGAGGSN